MRVQFTVEGGVGFFPGLRAPAVFDSATLTTEDAQTLERLVREAGIFEPSSTIPAEQGAGADQRSYTLIVDDGTEQRVVRVAEPVADPAMRALVAFLRAGAKDLRKRGRSSAAPE